jgi:hypothetical protein
LVFVVLFGDTDDGTGSGHDMLIGGDGDDLLVGDGSVGTGTDTVYGGADNDTEAGGGKGWDTTIDVETSDLENLSHSFTVGDYAQYRSDPESENILVYNHEWGGWDVFGAQTYNAELNAWVTNMGSVIFAEYQGRTLQYDNYGQGISMLVDGEWTSYDPDQEYAVDLREDPLTGQLNIYNNDMGTWDKYLSEYRPDGADYTILNEGNLVTVTYDVGTVLYHQNFGERAWVNVPGATSGTVEITGDEVYLDNSTGIWWSRNIDTWSYSMNGCLTWQQAPMLEITLSQEAGGAVNYFNGVQWTQENGVLKFVDTRYPIRIARNE